ncbi:MAG TPA: hypothetical protein VMR90_12300 [Candidatus Cybelea sp.]|nr:hypothetical protein [Candidatus Cybelea sp.]
MNRKLPWFAAAFFLVAPPLGAASKRARLLPNLLPGQTFTYLIRFQSDKTIKTESKVVAPMAPNAPQLDAHGLWRVEILDVQQSATRPAIRARGQFLTLGSDVSKNAPNEKNLDVNSQRPDPNLKSIEFTISPDGSVNNIKGLDSVSPGQQQVWQQWVARFALAWTLPADGMKFGEKWKSEQPELARAPITGLSWTRQSVYVRDEPCPSTQLSITGDVSLLTGPSDTCAVLLTTAKLKQNSPAKDATPEDFKLHELGTRGTAKGTSEIITYISLKTGLVVRATEETSQSMDVVVAKADVSNRVHYNVDAKSHAEVLLVTEPLPRQP